MKRTSFSSSFLLFVMALFLLAAQSAFAHELANHTAQFVKTAPDMGPADPSQVITIKLQLNGQGKDQVSRLIQQLHDPSSPSFQKWLTPDQFKSQFGVSAGESAVVQKLLTGNSLKIISSDGTSITAQGTLGSIQNAFHTQIHQFKVDGNIVRANITNPSVDDPAGALVSSISGLTEEFAQSHSVRPVDADGNPVSAIPLASLGADGLFFSPQCIRAPQVVSLKGVVANVPAGNPQAGQPAAAVYSGLRYGANVTNTAVGTLPPCGYQPSEVQTAYRLTPLFNSGLDGTGQTIVIIDAFGSPTLAADVALFSQLYGLPPVDLTQVVVNGPLTTTNAGFAGETTLDVEWAHAVAPGAKIVLVLAVNNSFTQLNAALQFAVDNHLGNVISNSFGAQEALLNPATITATEAIISQGAAEGISINYSTGDDGDFSIVDGPGVTTVSYPASSPFGTAIGGTSMAINSDDSILFQTGWGTNLTRLSLGTPGGANNPVVPPTNSAALGLGFQFGAGGGASGVFAKQHFQRRQPGNFRQVPDISYLADPFTGVEIIQTLGGVPSVEVIGGTSLACPMFSAMWAIANQAAGGGPLGQAAQTVYELGDNAITDIRDFSLPTNVFGFTQTPAGVTFESPDALSAPIFTQRRFVSALRQGASTSWFNITFGTDSSLTVDNGWDNVTGLGTPNGPDFVRRVVKQVNH